MPKELTHLTLSEKALEKIEEIEPALGNIIRQNYRLFMLGSIICDSAYYSIPIFSAKGDVSLISKRIHTVKGDIDGQFFKRLAENVPDEGRDAYLAFLYGILSHHLVDSSFHPLVSYLTGNYHDPDPDVRSRSVARHRFFEGLVDLWVAKHLANINIESFRLRDYIPLKFSRLSHCLFSFIEAVFDGDKRDETAFFVKRLYRAVRFQSALTGLYSNKIFRRLFIWLNSAARFKLSQFAAMIYPDGEYLSGSIFSETISYRDPFSGDGREESIKELADTVIEVIAEKIIESFNNSSSRGSIQYKNDAELWSSSTGSGRAGKTGRAEYFDTREIDKLLSDYLGMKGP